MKIIIPSVQVPFVKGGAELLIKNLSNALVEHGHEVEIITLPFKFLPEKSVSESIDIWTKQDFNSFNDCQIDKVIVLQFPAYYVKHDCKILWLIHQYRPVYELYNNQHAIRSLEALRKKVHLNDSTKLNSIENRYSISQNVSNRLKKYNGINSKPILHPPAYEKYFYCDESYDYIFCPSRLHALKRQDLLIKAMQYTKSPVVAIIAGEGGQFEIYKQLINALEVTDKVKMIGFISEEEKFTLYARSLAVFFAPFDEDYGYITIEAMLSSKPVITCNDSGGPLEFVVNEETGFIIDPDPRQVAQKIDWLFYNKTKSKELGINGLTHYRERKISWNNVVQTLLS